ncbi:MAG: NYN domain-containing protein [Parachlamydiales bacterium]|nr:NYN domain-containing protein [Parachlamydiales bacterium]
MIYLIDGYNVIFSLIHTKDSLQKMREKVIHYLQKRFAAKKISGMLVFDGAHRRDEESGLSYPSPLIVAYAPKGQSADEYIVEKIRVSKSPKQITVVTNDRGLRMHAKSAGAKILENELFIEWLKKKKKRTERGEVKETQANIDRLEKIFEERLKKDLGD